ncbi:conserved membrane hypothetical protein [Mesorhizobium prunaredense]|uniref:Uncharacterized protein n=1 Tax=Mesorhizobium prunaredense TaxID=1631249 RepID=A0A1R3V5N8_9HYPH|nr:conserved membrane hypothetical protein [Mesorhizobium prunaredense]
MKEPPFMRRLIKILIVFAFVFEILCLFFLSKGIGGYLVISSPGDFYETLGLRRLLLVLLMFGTAYMYLKYESHNDKIIRANLPHLSIKTVRFSQIGMIFVMASIAWLVS